MENKGKMTKPHKFFEKYLNNDLEKLSAFLLEKYNEIETQSLKNITKLDEKKDKFLYSKSISTIKWQEYNVFQFYNKEIYNLYTGVRELIKEACDYYEYDYNKEQFMIQGWFNVTYANVGKLHWHDHGPVGLKGPFFHGYYCVNAEPSNTIYKINNKEEKININKNNRLIVSEMGHQHAMADWDWEGPRITIAYDILPLRFLHKSIKEVVEQHWFPL